MNKNTSSGRQNADVVKIIRNREMTNRMVELYVWLFAALVLSGGLWISMFRNGGLYIDMLPDYYFEILVSLLTIFFPVVFKLIFGSLPLEAARRKRADRVSTSQESLKASVGGDIVGKDVNTIEVRIGSNTPDVGEMATYSSTGLFAFYAHSSRRLAESIYSRAGVYLLIGVLVAFSGVVFFYTQTSAAPMSQVQQANVSPATPKGETENISLLALLVPKLGILVFIELIAFFFLRQYRSAMDEFRYYEAIKRNREETFALLQMLTEGGKVVDPMELIKHNSFFSKAGSLSKDQTTEIIEARKLEKNEIELLERVVDVVSKAKK